MVNGIPYSQSSHNLLNIRVSDKPWRVASEFQERDVKIANNSAFCSACSFFSFSGMISGIGQQLLTNISGLSVLYVG
jgi:hypothetical protein